MTMETIGDTVSDCLLEKQRRIATLFLDNDEITFVSADNSHYNQKEIYTETVVNKRRLEQGLPPIVDIDDKISLWSNCAVDLIIADGILYIRPETDRMDLAMEADRILQEELKEVIPKQLIRFMYANLKETKIALRSAGEYWRISPYPRMEDEIKAEIARSRIALNGDPIYYYSSPTGTRYVTCDEFSKLALKDDDYLRKHLIEIRDYSDRKNTGGHREVAFFEGGTGFTYNEFQDLKFEDASPEDLRLMHGKLLLAFQAATKSVFQNDNPENVTWRNHMIAALIDSNDDTTDYKLVEELPDEFFRMVRWLPGGRFKERELIFDSVFIQQPDKKSPEELDELLDKRVKGFIGNFICEFGEIEYVNIGRVMPSIRRHKKRPNGHRIFLAEIKLPGNNKPVLRILRVIQWGMRERLDEGKDMLTAYSETMEYIEFTKQRRQGCWELGMPLPGRIEARTIPETYDGKQKKYNGQQIWTFYFERNFIDGLPTDKIPVEKLKNPEFCCNLARLLGQAAAPNIVVGRMDKEEKKVIFDGGDEMVICDSNGKPQRLVVADHAGTFHDYTSPLTTFAQAYAKPVINRLDKVENPDEFRKVYLESMRQRLLDLKVECMAQENSFKVRFQRDDEIAAGSFPDRWDKALTRLHETDIDVLIETISMEIDKG